MYRLQITELAQQDLDSSVAYIAIQLANRKAAGDFIDDVAVCYSFLKSNPTMYERCQDRRLKEAGYRKAVIKNYVLVYKVSEGLQIVNIMRFFYGAQDYAKLL